MSGLGVSRHVTAGRHKLVNIRQKTLLVAKWRALWVLAMFGAIAASAIVRIGFLGLFQSDVHRFSMADALTPDRGEIVDRRGQVLAREFKAYALSFNPKALDEGPPLVGNGRDVAAALARIFPDESAASFEKKLSSGDWGYLRRRILPEDANRVIALGEPALEFPREPDRYYPQGSLAAHVLGYVDSDKKGQVGMEQVFDEQLTDPIARAEPAMLSIDARVQGALEDELGRGMRLSDAKGAAAVILDVDTGEVLALASMPTFDPNRLKKYDMSGPIGKTGERGPPNGFNRVTNSVYELGSVFKPISVAAAIDAGTITHLGQSYQASRPLIVGGHPIRDSHTIASTLNVPQALIHSSNIVTAQIADELGGKRLKATMETLGMNDRPAIELPARGFPIWPEGDWSRVKTMTVSFGHGLAVTPLHLASAYAALVNGGVWRPATLRKLASEDVPAGRRLFKASTSARMRQILRMIVVYGTGKNADAPGFRVGGKTGSAEKPGKGGYRRSSLVSTFAAAFPMDHPRYVVVAMLDEPKGTAATSGQRTASWNAAPVVGRVIPRIGPLLGVMPDETRDIDISDLRPLIAREIAR